MRARAQRMKEVVRPAAASAEAIAGRSGAEPSGHGSSASQPSAQAPASAPVNGRALTVRQPVRIAGTEDRLIGQLLLDQGEFEAEQIDDVLDHQRVHGTRFGESAIQLGLVTREAVVFALTQQQQAPSDADTNAIGEVSDELVVIRAADTPSAEAIRDIRSRLLASVLKPDAPVRRALAVTSVAQGDGRSWFAANLAVSLSQLGARTLLVDANLRSPRLAELFGVSSSTRGLGSILQGHDRLNVVAPVPQLRRFFLLPAGEPPASPLELLQGHAFGMLMQELVARFDHVIVDTPAALAGADCRVIASACGAAIAIGRRAKTRVDHLQALVRELSTGDLAIAGVALVDH